MIDTKLLRQKILDLAIRGKLVPQNLTDEPASELLKKIKAEKEALVKSGKIKKDKHESHIFKGDDNRYYETIDGKTSDITDEIPFDLPDNWTWCRLISLYNFIDYRGKTPTKLVTGIPLITAKNVKKGYICYTPADFISEAEYKERQSRGVSKKGDLLFTTEAPLGNVALADFDEYSAGQRIITFQQYTKQNIFPNKLQLFFMLSPYFQHLLDSKHTGSTVAGIKAERLKKLLLPIPPLAEQQRIVEQIETLLKYVDIINADAETLEKYLSLAKQKVLDLAIRGKLVPQDPNDEPASVLLERIRAEKAKLIKEGKIKKDKHESIIFRRDNSHYEKLNGIERCIDDEIPFEIPESWAWVRLETMITLLSGQDFPPTGYNSKNEGIPYITGASNIENENILINRWTETPRNIAQQDDLLIVCKGAGVGKMAILQNSRVHIARQIMAVRCYNLVLNKYLMLHLTTKINKIRSQMNGLIPGIDRQVMLSILTPLPPLAEQKRIVAKIEELLPHIEEYGKAKTSPVPLNH